MNRHGSLSEQLKALLDYRNRPNIGPDDEIQTNWAASPDNDNASVKDYGFERHLRVTPSIQEIMKNAHYEPERNADGKVVRIGSLRFSDGTQTEKGYALGADGDVVICDCAMPVGAMLGTRENAERVRGGKGYTSAQEEQSNLYFAHMLGTIEPRFIPRTERRNGKSYTADESRKMLEEAMANTRFMPKVTKLKAGLPCGSRHIADSFVGMKKGKKGESGSVMWQDISSSIANREIWEETLSTLGAKDITTLDVAMTAQNMREIGEAHGFVGKRAERMGKKILRAANDNLADALKSAAA